jgi:hypothetical protein
MARALISSGLMVASAGTPAHAGAWSIAGQGQIGGSYDDNVRLSTVNKITDWSGVADVSAALSYQDEAFLLRLNPRLLVVQYDAARAFNRTEQYLTLQLQKTTETGSHSLSVSGTQDTTLTSELGLTGLSEVNKKHRVASVTVGSSWSLTERVDVGAQLYASASRYLDAQQTGLIDYNYGSALISASYDWTTRSRFTLQASAGQLQVPDIASYDKVNLSATLGYRVQLAPRWRAELSLGPSQIRTAGQAANGSVYNASLTHEAELTSLNLAVSKDVTPNGFGLLSRREQIRLGLTRTLSERWVTDWSAAVIRNQNVLPAGSVAQQAVTYADLTGSLRWRITPTWGMALSAGYTRQRISSLQPAAERQQAALNVTWNGLARPLN